MILPLLFETDTHQLSFPAVFTSCMPVTAFPEAGRPSLPKSIEPKSSQRATSGSQLAGTSNRFARKVEPWAKTSSAAPRMSFVAGAPAPLVHSSSAKLFCNCSISSLV